MRRGLAMRIRGETARVEGKAAIIAAPEAIAAASLPTPSRLSLGGLLLLIGP